MEESDLRFLSQKLLTCYKPCHSKTLSERGCTGFHISKTNNGSWIHNGFLDHDKFLGGRHTKSMERTRKFQILPFLCHFWPCRQGFRVGRGLERILSHMAPTCLDMSPYRAIWTHFKSNSMIFMNSIFKNHMSEGCGRGCLSTALHRHEQLAKYHPMPWLQNCKMT